MREGGTNLSYWRTWLRPGMLIKRWVALFLLSVTLTGLALAMGLAWLYRNVAVPEPWTGAVQLVTLQFIAHPWRELLLLTVGFCVLVFSLWRLSHSLIAPLMARSAGGQALAQIVYEHRFGPARAEFNVVAIGGGTGLSHLLRGLKRENLNVTAVVTVADDGGSTGRIRSEFDIPAPGDIRNCIVALADDESLVSQLFGYRFDQTGSALNGHSFGNLFITALTQVTGSFERAVLESSKVLNIRGRVLPSTLDNVTLCAELIDGQTICGESKIAKKTAPIKRVYLSLPSRQALAPGRPTAYQPALAAILNADLIVLGPGSLYTSVLPNLMVAGITEAIRWSRGTVVYVCNVATQAGETDHFSAVDHVRAIEDHIGSGVLDYVLINSNPASVDAITPDLQVDPVLPADLHRLGRRLKIVTQDVVSDRNPLRHDPAKLTGVLVAIARGRAEVAPAGAEVELLPAPATAAPDPSQAAAPAAAAAGDREGDRTLVSSGT